MKISTQDLNDIHKKFSDKQQKFLFDLGIYISGAPSTENSIVYIDEFFKFHGKDFDTLNELVAYEVFFVIKNEDIIELTSLGKLIALYHTHLYIKDAVLPISLLDAEYEDFSSLITNLKWKKQDENNYTLDLQKYESIVYKLEISETRLCLFETCKQCQKYIDVFEKAEPFVLEDAIKEINTYLKTRHLMLAEVNKRISNMF